MPINNVKELLIDWLDSHCIILEDEVISRIALVITPDRVSTRKINEK